jgi:hypothetical protein
VSPFEKKIVPKFETSKNSIFIFGFYDYKIGKWACALEIGCTCSVDTFLYKKSFSSAVVCKI